MGLATALDPARDLQRIHTLIMTNLAGFNILSDPNGPYYNEMAVQENPMQLHKTILAINEAAIELDNIHRTYKTLVEREMKYGSRQAPIGDDNYLHLMRGNLGTPISNSGTNNNMNNKHNNSTSATSSASTALSHSNNVVVQHHNTLNALDKSPRLYIRNEVLRNSLTNEKLSHY